MPAAEGAWRAVCRGLVGLTVAGARMKLRAASLLLLNPLAAVLLAMCAVAYIWVLVSEGGRLQGESLGGSWLRGAAFGFGLLLFLVIWTAQRGSPVRLQPGDVSWVLQSNQGPRVSLIFQAISGSLTAFVASSGASAVALALRGESPVFGLVSGFAIASLILLLRSVSLVAHVVGLVLPRALSGLVWSAVIVLSFVWVWLFIGHSFGAFYGWAAPDNAFDWFSGTIEAVIAPELGLPIASVVAMLAASGGVVIAAVYAQRFVEPAVHESILANQLSKVLSGGKTIGALQGRGFQTGLRSWQNWPQSPIAALLVSHFAQARRRKWQHVGSAVTFVALATMPIFFRNVLPVSVGVVAILLLSSLSAASQTFTADITHQHLVLSGVSMIKAGFAAIMLSGLISFVSLLPAVLAWGAFYYQNFLASLLLVPPLILYCLMMALAGFAACVFSEMPIGRAIASLVLCAVPLLASVSAFSAYSDPLDVARLVLTVSGTVLVAGMIYAGIVYAVLDGSRAFDLYKSPQSSES